MRVYQFRHARGRYFKGARRIAIVAASTSVNGKKGREIREIGHSRRRNAYLVSRALATIASKSGNASSK